MADLNSTTWMIPLRWSIFQSPTVVELWNGWISGNSSEKSFLTSPCQIMSLWTTLLCPGLMIRTCQLSFINLHRSLNPSPLCIYWMRMSSACVHLPNDWYNSWIFWLNVKFQIFVAPPFMSELWIFILCNILAFVLPSWWDLTIYHFGLLISVKLWVKLLKHFAIYIICFASVIMASN